MGLLLGPEARHSCEAWMKAWDGCLSSCGAASDIRSDHLMNPFQALSLQHTQPVCWLLIIVVLGLCLHVVDGCTMRLVLHLMGVYKGHCCKATGSVAAAGSAPSSGTAQVKLVNGLAVLLVDG